MKMFIHTLQTASIVLRHTLYILYRDSSPLAQRVHPPKLIGRTASTSNRVSLNPAMAFGDAMGGSSRDALRGARGFVRETAGSTRSSGCVDAARKEVWLEGQKGAHDDEVR